jgi:hypothetical protein
MSIHLERAQINQCGVKADALCRVVLAGVEPPSASKWVLMWVARSKRLNSKSFYSYLQILGEIFEWGVHIWVS